MRAERPDRLVQPQRYTSCAAPGDADPADASVHAVHDRYLLEVIEGLGLCPFARKSRESGRVVRELIRGGEEGWTLGTAVQRVQARAAEARNWEIILLTFPPTGTEPQFPDHSGFEAFHRSFREGLAASGIDKRYFSVCFHPLAGRTPVCETRAAAFVQILRRAPDPVIQCVHVETLERVRRQAQRQASGRLKQALIRAQGGSARGAGAPRRRAILTDSELSQDIMQGNFERLSSGEGRRQLESAFRAVERLRESLYALAP